MRIYKHMKANGHVKVFLEHFDIKDSTNGKEHTKAHRIQRLDLGVRKHEGSDIDQSNPYGGWVVILLATLKVLMLQTPPIIAKKKNTFERGPTMYISFANEGKTQVKWAIVVGWKVQR